MHLKELMTTEKTLFALDQECEQLGITEEENESYHSSVGLSFSGLKQLSKTPAHYIASRSRDDEETASQRLGTLVHMAILERDRFRSSVVAIEGHRGKKDVKEEIAHAEMNGKYVCKPDEYMATIKMADAILLNPSAEKLLTGGAAERSIRWRDPETGVLLKCRPDYLRDDGIVVDLKTFNDLNEDNLQRHILKSKYHWQSRFYLDGVNQVLGLKSNMFAHIFIDTEAYVSRVVVLDDASLEKAETLIRPLIQLYSECLKNDVWPGYPPEILTTSIPSWAW
jgi:hypothetical protein